MTPCLKCVELYTRIPNLCLKFVLSYGDRSYGPPKSEGVGGGSGQPASNCRTLRTTVLRMRSPREWHHSIPLAKSCRLTCISRAGYKLMVGC